MKRSLLLLILAVVILPGCKKEYTCACGDMNTELVPVFRVSGSKHKAEEKCNEYRQNTPAIANYTCKII